MKKLTMVILATVAILAFTGTKAEAGSFNGIIYTN